MTHVLASHKVNDYAKWKQTFDNFASTRKAAGEKSFLIMHSQNQPNDLTLLFEWDNRQNAEKFMHSPELKKAMEQGGVAGAPDIKFLDDAAQGKL